TDRVKLLGKKDNVLEYLRASDYFVSLSKSEGLPMSVLEAMGTGLPVLLSDIYPHRELIRNNGNGVLVSTSDINNIVKGFEKIFNNDKQNMGILSRKIIEENYTAKIMANQYLEVYEEIKK